MSAWIILFTSLGYLGLLFAIAYVSEKLENKGKSLIRNPYVYALSLAVYCTAWTFYGSVGRAATDGAEFLCIYLGPTLMAPLWFKVLRKIVMISQSQRINSIADFISARYGKSAFLGGLVTVIAIFGVIPYISLQLKAVSFSFDLITQDSHFLSTTFSGENFYQDTAFYTAIILAVFTILFGTRHLEATERHEGLVAAVAFESFVKLIAFLAVGIFVTFLLHDGPTDLFTKAQDSPAVQHLLDSGTTSEVDPWGWFWLIIISMLAVLLLPRQFHIAVVENTYPGHINKAIWLFPLYLFLINLFVVPIAMGGLLEFSDTARMADTYVLRLPLAHDQELLALLAFIGGVSASTSMVIVATIALSIMASNNLVVPLLLRTAIIKETFVHDLSGRLRAIRRLVIVVILLLAYVYFISIGQDAPLVSIGLISFTAVAQFGPALLGGIYWREATRSGAAAGMIAGFVVWGFTLPFGSLIQAGHLSASIMDEGLLGLGLLRPYALFGLEGFDQISHSAFWSLLFNVAFYVGGSFYSRHSAIERTQAHLFVNIHRQEMTDQDAGIWRGRAFLHDIQMLLNRFLGRERTDELLSTYARRNRVNLDQSVEVGGELVNYAEKLLAGAIGSASSRLLIASIVKEEPLTRQDMMEVLDETQQLVRYSRELEKKSRELERASQKLRAANDRLREMDKLKNDFITTVTHELRTPITSIRSLSNILHSTENLKPQKRQEFLHIIIKESERISRLINQVLDLEKMESGHAEWNLTEVDMLEVIETSATGLRALCQERGIELTQDLPDQMPRLKGDRDRLTQVVINLLSNAVKFCPPEKGLVHISLRAEQDSACIAISDNGPGIDPAVQPYIFDKFTQFNDYKSKGQQGSGLGLSISWRIVRIHRGTITVESTPGEGATFIVKLPLEGASLEQMRTPSYRRRPE